MQRKHNAHLNQKGYVSSVHDTSIILLNFFFLSGVFFHENSRFTRQQGKGEAIPLTPLYHFHPFHRHLDISRAITAQSSPLHIGSSRTRFLRFSMLYYFDIPVKNSLVTTLEKMLMKTFLVISLV